MVTGLLGEKAVVLGFLGLDQAMAQEIVIDEAAAGKQRTPSQS